MRRGKDTWRFRVNESTAIRGLIANCRNVALVNIRYFDSRLSGLRCLEKVCGSMYLQDYDKSNPELAEME